MEEKQENKKKSFISEKIVGRDLTLRHAAKYLGLAVVCGLVFGICGAVAFNSLGTHLQKRTEAMALGNSQEPESQSESPEAPVSAESQEGQEPAAAEGTAGAAPEEPAETTAGNEAASPEPSGETDTAGSIQETVRRELENRTPTPEEGRKLFAGLQEVVAEADSRVVSVQAVERDTSWFNDPIETAYNASGLILSIREQEILILTTEDAVRNADNLRVTFADGAEQEAYLKQSSRQDGVALLSVPKEGLGSEFLSSISPIAYGSAGTLQTGDLIFLIGSPLGTAHSVSMGLIGYVNEKEQTADGTQAMFYTGVPADAEKGTFAVDLKGELIGVVRPALGESQTGSTGIISTAYLREVLRRLGEGKQIPYLGIRGRNVTPEMKFEDIPAGVYVTEVEQDSPAYGAGIKNGDILIRLNDTELSDLSAYESAVRGLETGDSAALTVMRSSTNGEYGELTFNITAGAR